MWKRMMLVFVLSILVAALSGSVLAQEREIEPLKMSWDAPVTVRPPEDNDGNDFGFGKRIAGTWLGTGEFTPDFDCNGEVDNPAWTTVYDYDSQSFTASGFWLVTQPLDALPGHGTWKKTGTREITADSIGYIKNAETGALEWVMRIPAVFTFSADFQTATSTFGAIGYSPDQDPLDPDAVPVWCTIGQHYELRKVNP